MNHTHDRLRQDRSALETELRQAGAEIRGAAFKCPAHDDKHASGSIYSGEDGSWRAKCHVCDFAGDLFDLRAWRTGRPVGEILREADGDAGKSDRQRNKQRPSERVFKSLPDLRLAVARMGVIEAEYGPDYADPDSGAIGLNIFRVRTGDGKRFVQCHPVAGGWSMTAPPKPWPLYNRAAVRGGSEILVVEGEKCANALNAIGFAATTNPGGAGNAKHTDWSPLAGKGVWLWPDNDPDGTGRRHMQDVATIVGGLEPASLLFWIEPADLDLADKEDAYDFVEQCRIAGMDPRQAVSDAMLRAKPLSPSTGLRDEIEGEITGRIRDIPWPWPNLSRLARSQLPHSVAILCGAPGAAKSFSLLKALVTWFERGVTIAHLALEKDRTYWLKRVLALRDCNVELLDPEWVKMNADGARAAYERHREFLDRFGKRLWDSPARTLTLAEVATWIRERAIEGVRIISVDPVTATAATERPWVVDTEFVNAVRAIVLAFDVSLLLVTHPKKGSSRAVGLDDLAGGAVYQRLSDTVLWIEKHVQPKTVIVSGPCGRFDTEINQTIHVCKSRGPGHGLSVGFCIDWPSLEFAEQGTVLKHKKEPREG